MATNRELLQEIVFLKEKQKEDLRKQRGEALKIIYSGLCKEDKLSKIHKRLKDNIVNKKILVLALKTVNKIKKQINKKSVEDMIKVEPKLEGQPFNVLLASFIYDRLKKVKFEKAVNKVIVQESDSKEADNKAKVLNDLLDKTREETKEELKHKDLDLDKIKIFFLASKHNDSALDHIDWQGKIYYDENWYKLKLPTSLRETINYLIQRRQLKSFQWVIGKPVYFITRPNCRHYFKEISLKEAMGESAKSLVEKYNMQQAIGDRKYLQTIKHATDREWYDDVRNAQLLLEKYKERLKEHEELYKEQKTPILEDAIKKDKFLIKRWREYIKRKGGK